MTYEDKASYESTPPCSMLEHTYIIETRLSDEDAEYLHVKDVISVTNSVYAKYTYIIETRLSEEDAEYLHVEDVISVTNSVYVAHGRCDICHELCICCTWKM